MSAVIFKPTGVTSKRLYSYGILFPDECPICGSYADEEFGFVFSWKRRIGQHTNLIWERTFEAKYCPKHSSDIVTSIKEKKKKAWFQRKTALRTFAGLIIIALVLLSWKLFDSLWRTTENFQIFAACSITYILIIGGISYLVSGWIYNMRYHYDENRIKCGYDVDHMSSPGEKIHKYDLLVITCDRKEYAEKLHQLNSNSEIRIF
ncbi:MAG: hypothetical protein V1849_02630 [Chloroflexota bacterium]